MKQVFKILIPIVLVLFASCEERIDEINVNPDTFPQGPDAQVLTSAIGYLGYIQDVDLNAASFLWAQYYTWGIGVSIGNQERFVSQPDDFNGYWNRAHATSLKDLHYLKQSDAPAYRGVAKILTAYIYQGLVDHFGDVPYSQASLGDAGILTPAYDNAADIYADLVIQLDDALADFDLATTLGEDEVIGAEDLIYGGDLGQWTKFANSLKLRILMRTSETNPQGAAVQALVASSEFIETESDMPQIDFANVSGNQNPMYARFEWGVGDFYFASNAILNVLDNLGDPRNEAFYDKATTGTFAGQIYGIDQGTIDNEIFTNPSTHYSGSSSIAYGPANSVLLMSPWEVWFLRAEADARYTTTDDEVTAFETAVQANFNYWGVAGGAAYITSLTYSAANPLDDRLNNIAVQKWISLNGTQEDEGWIETRRFDRPNHRIFTDGIFQKPPLSVLSDIGGKPQFPSAWLIPASERSLNPKAPAQRVITDKIFWDN